METIITEVKKTSDYSFFKRLDGNRIIDPIHFNRLKKSIEKNYLISPILINEKDEIIDGNHRFAVEKELGLPVYYIRVHGYGLNEVKILNSNMKNWTKEDYLNAYCDLGYKNYLEFRNFKREFYDFGFNSCEVLLTQGGICKTKEEKINGSARNVYSRYFQEGDFVINDYEFARESAMKLRMIKQYFKRYNICIFVRTMVLIFKNKDYIHSEFMSKLRNNPTKLQPCLNISQYKLLIEDIYNCRRPNNKKISLRFS